MENLTAMPPSYEALDQAPSPVIPPEPEGQAAQQGPAEPYGPPPAYSGPVAITEAFEALAQWFTSYAQGHGMDTADLVTKLSRLVEYMKTGH